MSEKCKNKSFNNECVTKSLNNIYIFLKFCSTKTYYRFKHLELIYSEKATKCLRNLHLPFVLCSASQNWIGDFSKFVAFSEYMTFTYAGIMENRNVKILKAMGRGSPQYIFEDQLTLFRLGWRVDYAHHITACPLRFPELPTALYLLIKVARGGFKLMIQI